MVRLFCDITDVLRLFQVDRVLLMIYQPGKELAPLGKNIDEIQNGSQQILANSIFTFISSYNKPRNLILVAKYLF